MGQLNILKRLILLIVIIISYHETSYSQKSKIDNVNIDTVSLFIIKQKGGIIDVGRIHEVTEKYLVLTKLNGEKTNIPLKNLKNIEQIDSSFYKYTKDWLPYIDATRYLFTTSAFNLKKGEFYYQNIYLSSNFIHYGITDNFTVGVGTELVSLLSFNQPVIFLNSQYSYKVSPILRLGVGGSIYSSFGYRGKVGFYYGIVTLGKKHQNISASFGRSFLTEDINSQPLIIISGIFQINKRVALISENWIAPSFNYYEVFSYGIRIFGKKISVDIALINNKDISRFIPIGIPYGSFSYKF